MIVRDMMKTLPKTCTPATNLAAVTELLWSAGCGALPVVDSDGKMTGIITDRDICVAVGTRNKRPSELVAEDVMTRSVSVCHAGDEIHDALKAMRTGKVRRLPVVDDAGSLEGILCLSDLIVQARHDGHRQSLTYEDVMVTLKDISSRHRAALAAGR
jgi:CBS domain-containing protein